MSQLDNKTVIDSLLFVSDKPVSHLEMSKVLGVEAKEIKNTIELLKAEYEQQRRGFRILQIAGGYQMCTASETAEWVKKMQSYKYSQRLTGASLETVAIIAYKQPVTKIEIEMIRGVNVDNIIKN